MPVIPGLATLAAAIAGVFKSKSPAKHDQFFKFYFNRICPMWNSLPENIVTASIAIFKNRL